MMILRGFGLVVKPHGVMIITKSQLCSPEGCLASDVLPCIAKVLLIGILIYLCTTVRLCRRRPCI